MTRSPRPAVLPRSVVAGWRGRRLAGLALGLALLAPSSPVVAQASPSAAASRETVACPDFLPDGGQCWRGADPRGGYYWIAVPADWNGVLVVHAHGGPRLGEPEPDDPLEDLERFSMTVREGFAWAGHTYRRGGYGVRMAAEDTDHLRQIAWETLGKPRRTLLHGQSWGGNVAAKAAELYARDAEGRVQWDGVVISNGLLAGGTRGYQFRADLRAVYQYVCRNHPRPDEPAYPPWRGLPQDARLTRAELTRRVEACTGIDRPEAERTAEQRQNLSDILTVVGIREDNLVSHLAWATFTFRDLVGRLDGLNPFDNTTRVYAGSHDDAALNAGVERFAADPDGLARLAYDADLTGLIVAPTLTIHARHDPVVFASHEDEYREKVAAVGRSRLLVQTFTEEDQHSRLSPPQYVAIFEAMMRWLDQGERPTPDTVAALCEAAAPRYDAPCLFERAVSALEDSSR